MPTSGWGRKCATLERVSKADIPLGPSQARCATHPEVEATGTCARCGTFYCEGCVQQVFGKPWCATCAARPEVHYLEHFRLKLWGRRDGSGWAALVVGLSFGLAAFHGLSERTPALPVLAFAACSAVGICFFLGLRWAREAFICVPLLFVVLCRLKGFGGLAFFFLVVAVSGLIVYFDTRNQLFFRRPVSPERLERLWHLLENNPMARRALSLAAGSIILPVLAPLAVLFGVVGLRRVDPEAVPPIGRKREAVGAIVLGVVVMGVWAAVLWSRINGSFGLSIGR